ncbi:Tetratricopeptide repeat protein [Roseovarius albus]|uniref:Tetratricopeptide repeat protein 38 n=1 Tax=Roseovarius albus TaxID=1247867 RepID=A0A1X6YMF4_9RHOB|nr:tetratricopeptide repeat protein [Roseovarius albus]SLN25010.1 Tetratricopeptide repeat protein [Roseovarius albus]
MKSDLFGNDVSLTSDAHVASWDALQLAFLAHGASAPTHLGAVLEGAPDFAMAHALKGLFCVMLGRTEMTATAREAQAAAHKAMATGLATPRERLFVDALDHWLAGQPVLAINAMEEVLKHNPQDSAAMKISHAIRFILGDAAGMRQSIERVLPSYGADHAGLGYLKGCYAFALEETGDYALAEKIGREAVEHTPNDAWGLHAVAHVYDMTANSAAGLNWLTGREAAWAHCNNFRYHVWWHKALMHLDAGQVDEVLALYDTEIRKDHTDDYRDISNGASLLMRLELDGVDVGHRWEEMASISEARTEDGCLIFADLHYLLALMGGNRDAALGRLVGRIHEDAKASQTEAQMRMANPGMAAADGLEAFGEGDYKSAFLNLAQARRHMQGAGGSHAQRDVFERMTIDAGIRAGLFDDARDILDDRKTRRDGHEDGYAAARYQMIADFQHNAEQGLRLPAE